MQTIWLNPTDFVSGDPTLVIGYPSAGHPGSVEARGTTADPKFLFMGLLLPPDVTIEEVIITYQAPNPGSFISRIILGDIHTPDHAIPFHEDKTKLDSKIPASHTTKLGVGGFVPPAAVTLSLQLNFANDTDVILFGAVGVTVQSVVGPVAFNVKGYGAKGNNSADDTGAIQAAITAAVAAGSGATVFFPAGNYRSGLLTIDTASNLTVCGLGSSAIIWVGTASGVGNDIIGLGLRGICYNVLIRDLTLLGSTKASDNHYGVFAYSGSQLERCGVERCRIRDGAVGIQLSANSVGSAVGGFARNNHIYHPHGTTSGHGYGIVNAGGIDVQITGNIVERAERHSIYHAAGSQGLIAGNTIKDHRIDVFDGSFREAVVVARSQHVAILGNMFDNCHDGCIDVEPDVSVGQQAENIHIADNLAYNPHQHFIRVQDNSTPSLLQNCQWVSVDNNHIYSDLTLTNTLMRFGGVRDLWITNNHFIVKNHTAEIDCIYLDALGDSGGTAAHNDRWFIENNQIFAAPGGGGSTGSIVLTANTATATTSVFIGHNDQSGATSLFNSNATITNPNVTLADQAWDSHPTWSSAAGSLATEFQTLRVKGNAIGQPEGYLELFNVDPSGSRWRLGEMFAAAQLSAREMGTGREVLRLDASPVDGAVGMLVTRNVGGTFSMQRVTMGVADSGGTGFKLLRVPN